VTVFVTSHECRRPDNVVARFLLLAWLAIEFHTHSCVTELSIDRQRIIGLWRADAASDEHQLLYVHEDESTTGDAAKSAVRTQVVKVDRLPSDFVEKYLISNAQSPLFVGDSGSKENDRELSFIISTGSGVKQAAEFFEISVKPILDVLGLDGAYKTYVTSSADSITELGRTVFVQKANAGIAQTIVLLSGDGGTIDLVNALWEETQKTAYAKPTLVTLPLGTGNALSNSHRYNEDQTNGLSTLVRGNFRTLPTFRAEFSPGARLVVNEGREEQRLPEYEGAPAMWGVVVASWGLHASLVADSDTAHYRQFGAQRFQMVAKELLFPEDGGVHHAYAGTVSVADHVGGPYQELERKEHSYVLATLVSNLEKTFCISPDSKALDGRLRLVEIPAMLGDELMGVMQAGYQDGKHVGMDKVGYHEIEGLSITFDEDDDRWRRVCIDGKIVKVEKGGYVRITRESDTRANIASL
jgi:diacylglycerol kinase family enzyme